MRTTTNKLFETKELDFSTIEKSIEILKYTRKALLSEIELNKDFLDDVLDCIDISSNNEELEDITDEDLELVRNYKEKIYTFEKAIMYLEESILELAKENK